MAAGLLALRSAVGYGSRSAGSDPAETINPVAAQVMAEVGVDDSRKLITLLPAAPQPLDGAPARRRDHAGVLAGQSRELAAG